ncbi:MAG: HPr(Ser) kinase/phosphatase [Chromatiaceae bacterium]|nr:HPr(Ser) kinase/phosphatase [Chromatiaceae bacterium]MCF7994226.1 HPr(Ser) kinase/phosphatase [Chromatiaceae bacterium]MCF8003179.1 HPr(Ser) kinase/phosphatase [Chromatiaceae bacterium]MCF8016184.1 HPr(Ser) kinase/phosphatase [Chromatiaceae bacterium]
MPPVDTLQGLVEHLGPRLGLRWLTPVPDQPLALLSSDSSAGAAQSGAAQSLVGSLNCIHPNRLQVLGLAEIHHLADLSRAAGRDIVERLFAAQPAAVIFAQDIDPPPGFFARAEQSGTPLLSSPRAEEEIVDRLQYFLTYALAERTTLHGVFLDVLGMGVLLMGDPGIGKSELALEMVVRGHRLIADDAPEVARIGPETLEGSCPELLRDFLEVRGLGVLNVRAMFGEGALQRREQLNLIVNMRSFDGDALAQMDRLRGSLSTRTILGVSVPEVTLPVAPGRNLAVLLETAVRNQILRLRGYDAGVDLIDRQSRSIDENARCLTPTPFV